FMGLIVSRNKRRVILELLFASFLSFGIVLLQNSQSNARMPGGDFVIGAPLLGYANHLARMLHVSAELLNPISTSSHLHWNSVFLVPFFLFHFFRFALIDPKILSALIALLVFRTQLWNRSHELAWMLMLLLPIGFLLPVLYSPAWYPLALSFYTPLVSAQAAILIGAMGFGTFLQSVQDRKYDAFLRLPRSAIGIVALILLFGVCLNLRDILRADTSKGSIVTPELIQAMTFLNEHTPLPATIATHRFDFDTSLDESYYWYAALSRRTFISEGAKYGSLLSAVADTNSEKGLHRVRAAEQLLERRRAELDTIFGSVDSNAIRSALMRSGASFILEGNADSERLHIAISTIIEPQFSNGRYRIWKVR
ncbi:MAG TPA: hypothetical protein VGM92_02635, partial [Candidatus Kapabacteria bacterium]